jgi:hypothetical protein
MTLPAIDTFKAPSESQSKDKDLKHSALGMDSFHLSGFLRWERAAASQAYTTITSRRSKENGGRV